MSRITPLPVTAWAARPAPDLSEQAIVALERGDVLFLPNLSFVVERQEREIFSPAILSTSKNTSFDPSTGRVSGTTLRGVALDRLRAVLQRFSESAAQLVDGLLPDYRHHRVHARASFRPAEVAGRQTSWRKDDTRLHIDSFPASPVQGRRILRVFSNVNPDGRPRTWRVGGDFRDVADRFRAALNVPWPGSGLVLQALRVTKSRRSAYDAIMLELHDCMKEDGAFQRESPQQLFDFPAGSTWLGFTDQVSHAAMAGQYQFEQTFLLPVDAMRDTGQAPLRVLETIFQRRLT